MFNKSYEKGNTASYFKNAGIFQISHIFMILSSDKIVSHLEWWVLSILVLLWDVIRVIMMHCFLMHASEGFLHYNSQRSKNETAQLVYKRGHLLLKGNITMDKNELASVGLLYRLIEHLFVFSVEARGASQRCWPSRLTLRSHLLFSCSPAEGSSRRAVPSGEPRASVPNKASLCTPPCPANPPPPI